MAQRVFSLLGLQFWLAAHELQRPWPKGLPEWGSLDFEAEKLFIARSLSNLKAILGQLYPATPHARLVSLEVGPIEAAHQVADPESPDSRG